MGPDASIQNFMDSEKEEGPVYNNRKEAYDKFSDEFIIR